MAASMVPGLTSIIIVSADSGPLLRRCVDSVLASAASVEVVLVDNASADGELERIESARANDPRLHVLRNGVNLGFGPACNKGAAIARGDVLVILNPDCEVQPTFVRDVRSCIDAAEDIGLLGVMVCEPDGTPARGNRRRDPTLRRALASITGLARLESRWPAFAGVEMPAWVGAPPSIEPVEAVSGACMVLPRHVFEQLRGFDEGYFLHAEDLDLCRRVRDAGFRVAIAHAVRVIHARGNSSRHRPVFVARHKHRGMWRYFCKFDPAARNGVVRLLVRVGLWLHFSATLPALALRKLRASY
jgi:N-acetylglucosaminyl-diphospho-decaprenol L-rhamnosyltransferase